MKRLLLLPIVFFSVGILAQNTEYSIIVKDIETQLPIENATVLIMKTKQVLLTNEEGKVSFVLSGASNVQVSDMDYDHITLRWTTLKDNDFVVYLKDKNNKLDEIVVSRENPQKILQKIVSHSIKKLSSPYRLKVYVREFFMLDNQYSYYNDGLVNFQFSGHEKKNTTTLLVEQNRSYGLLEADVSTDLRGYNLNNIMENYSNLTYFDPVLDSKKKKEYDYIISGHPNNKNYYIMKVTPLNTSKKELEDFEIIYDPEKKVIIEFTITTTQQNLDKIADKTVIGSKNITRSFIKVDYRLDGEDYYLLNSNEEIAYNLILKDKVKNIQVRNSFITTNFNKQNFTYRESDVFKEKTLFNKQNKILTNYWDISGFTATDQEKAIIKALDFKM